MNQTAKEKESDLGKILRLQHGALEMSGRALKEREIVARGLILAKERPTQTDVIQAMVYIGYLGIADEPQSSQGGPDWEAGYIRFIGRKPQLRDQMNIYWDNLDDRRRNFRKRLVAVLANPQKAAKEMALELDDYRRDMLIITLPIRDGSRLRLEHHYYPQTSQASFGYVLDLLLYGGFAKDLRRCTFPPCQAFYLSMPNSLGGRRPVYCSTECGAASRKIQAAERQAKHRSEKRSRARRRRVGSASPRSGGRSSR